MQLRSVASDWQRWQLKQKFATVHGKTKAVDVNPSLSARFLNPKLFLGYCHGLNIIQPNSHWSADVYVFCKSHNYHAGCQTGRFFRANGDSARLVHQPNQLLV